MTKAKKKNMFEQADEAAKTEAPAKGKGKGRSVIVRGLKKLAVLKTVVKTLQALCDTTQPEVYSAVNEEFIKEGQAAGKQPENFTATEDSAEASAQLRKRSTRSPLTEEAQATLTDHGITLGKIIDRKALYAVNEKYERDQKVLAEVSKFLEKRWPDFIVKQTEISRAVTTEDTIDEVFAKIKDTERLHQVLPLVSDLALKITDEDTAVADQIVADVLEKIK